MIVTEEIVESFEELLQRNVMASLACCLLALLVTVVTGEMLEDGELVS